MTYYAIGALVIAIASVATAQFIEHRLRQQRRRRAARQAQNMEIKSSPHDYVTERKAHLTAEVAKLREALQNGLRTESQLIADLMNLAPPLWVGVRRLLRLACLMLLPALVISSGVLNVEVFIALNGGIISAPAVLKGIGATIVELLLTLYFSDLVIHRQPRAVAWQIQVAACLALLFVVIGYVSHYAPARSQQALQRIIGLNHRQVTAAVTADAQIGSLQTHLAVTAARDTLSNNVSRLKKAEKSDAGQSIAFPVAELLVGELALGGWLAALDLRRRRIGRSRLKRQRERNDQLRTAIMGLGAMRWAQVQARLFEAGVRDLAALGDYGRWSGEPRNELSSGRPEVSEKPPAPPSRRPHGAYRPPARRKHPFRPPSGPADASQTASGKAVPAGTQERSAHDRPPQSRTPRHPGVPTSLMSRRLRRRRQ